MVECLRGKKKKEKKKREERRRKEERKSKRGKKERKERKEREGREGERERKKQRSWDRSSSHILEQNQRRKAGRRQPVGVCQCRQSGGIQDRRKKREAAGSLEGRTVAGEALPPSPA